MDKKKVLEVKEEFEKAKNHAEKRKMQKKLSKELDEKYDFQSVNIKEIREKVYEEERARENDGVDAYSWFGKK